MIRGNQEFEPGRIKMPTESPSGTPPNVRLFLATNKKLYARHAPKEQYHHKRSPLRLHRGLKLFRNSYARLNQQLQSIWYSKIEAIIYLELAQLLVDLTEAYDIDGEFLGTKQIGYLVTTHRFCSGPSAKLVIRAPTKPLESWIQGAVILHAL